MQSSGALGLVGGKYRLVRELGRGSAGVVYTARVEPGEELVALKLLGGVEGLDPARVRRAAEALARVPPHGNVVGVKGAGEHEGSPYLVLELVTGGSLARALEKHWPDPAQAVSLGAKLARALAHLHRAGIVHRDVQPSSVLLDGAGEPRLGDFGLALDSARLSRLATTGEPVGMLGFAPEQLAGAGEVGPPADVYALSLLLYLLIARRHAFGRARTLRELAAIAGERAEPLEKWAPRMPADVASAIGRGLEPLPRDRPSAEELASALERALAASPRTSGRVPTTSPGTTPDGDTGRTAKRPSTRKDSDSATGGSARFPAPRLGTTVGDYVLEAILGQGGTGAVYRARGRDGREVALKLLRRAPSEEALARFEREKRLLAAFGESEGFVPLLERGESPHGPFLVMPLLEGGTLRGRLERGPFAVEETLALGRALARAVALAHERGIVHRDLKPENVLFTGDGRPLVADLGLAKHFLRVPLDAASVSLSAAGDLRGTIGYAAPEQMADAKSVGPEADVFSLAAILHECLAGAPAFSGAGVVELVGAVESGRFVPLLDVRPEAPPWLARVLEQAMARKPEHRFPGAAAFERALAGPSRGRRPLIVSALLVPLALAALALGGWALHGHDESSARAAADELCDRAAALSDKHDDDGALEACSRAVELAPGFARAWACRAAHRISKNDPGGALADATRATELDPRLAAGWVNRGAALAKKGDIEGAIAAATRAIELDSKEPVALTVRGTARLMKNDLEGAIADLSAAIRLDDTSSNTRSNLAAARARKGDLDGSIADATRAIELDPRNASAWLNRAASRGAKEDLDGAIADATRAIELDPKEPGGWKNRGADRLGKGDRDGAIADLSRGLELDPRDATLWATRGEAYLDKGELDPALADFSRAVELDPRDAGSWSNRGAVRAHKGDRDGAIADFSRSVELDPKNVGVWRNLAHAQHENGDRAGEIVSLTRALELDQKDTASWESRALARFELSDHEGAIADFTRVIELDPKNAQAWSSRGGARLEQGDPDGAIADTTRAIELAADFPGAWMNRAGARGKKGDHDGAISDATHAIELDDTIANAWVNRATSRFEKGDLDGTIADCSKAIELERGHALAWHYRGLARRKQGDAAGAAADFERARALDPSLKSD